MRKTFTFFMAILIIAILMLPVFCLAQITQVTIPNDTGTGSIVVNLPDGLSIPIGFNSGGAFVLILIIIVGIGKRFPIIKSKFETMLPKVKDAWIITSVYVAALLSGVISLLLKQYLGVPTPITWQNLISASLAYGSFAIGAHSLILRGLYEGFIKSYLNSKEVDSMKSTMKSLAFIAGCLIGAVLLASSPRAQTSTPYQSTYGYSTAISGQQKIVATKTSAVSPQFRGITVWSSSSTITVTVYDASSYAQATGISKYLIPTSTISTQQITKEQGITIYNDKLGTDVNCDYGILVYITGAVDCRYQILWKNKP